ncbi:hypothetical protein V492_01499 [Pseudogymnoascus sp. VKM F-4246]|nr:hypothetical protein V492_01499 [Pseudogymnoascus sp. VKM F-4246]
MGMVNPSTRYSSLSGNTAYTTPSSRLPVSPEPGPRRQATGNQHETKNQNHCCGTAPYVGQRPGSDYGMPSTYRAERCWEDAVRTAGLGPTEMGRERDQGRDPGGWVGGLWSGSAFDHIISHPPRRYMQARVHHLTIDQANLTIDQANITSPLSSIPKADPSPSQPTHPGPSAQHLNAMFRTQGSTEQQHRTAHPPEALTDCMERPASSAAQTACSRRCGRDCDRRRAAAALRRASFTLACQQRNLSDPSRAVSRTTARNPNSQSPQPRAPTNKPLPSPRETETIPSLPTSRVCLPEHTHDRKAAFGACLCCLTASLGLGRRVPFPDPAGWLAKDGCGPPRVVLDHSQTPTHATAARTNKRGLVNPGGVSYHHMRSPAARQAADADRPVRLML